MTTQGSHLRGQSVLVPLRKLKFDAENPRLPEAYRGGSQSTLASVLERGFEAFAVAQSIADNGYFAAEPLLVVADVGESGHYIVVEGNRRLAALKGLADPTVREEFEQATKWDGLAASAVVDLETSIPVVVHSSRESSHAEVARAHVVGKLSWNPYMQARFIAARVAEGRTIAEVAELIGIEKGKAANLYRDQAVVKQAAALGLNTQEVERAFSLVTVAMSNTKIRDHVGVPLGSRLEPGVQPVPDDRKEELEEIIRWVFGDEDHEPVITDSRQMGKLGNVISSPVGLAALRGGASLEQADQKSKLAGMDPRLRLLQRLVAAKNALSAASGDIGDYTADTEVLSALADVTSQLDDLNNLIFATEGLQGVDG